MSVEYNVYPGQALTNREIEVLQHAYLSNGEIAKELHISKRTVEMHLRRIQIKLEVTNTKAAIFVGFREGLIG